MRIAFLVLVMLGGLLWTGCNQTAQSEPAASAPPAPASDNKTFTVQGIVKKLDPDGKTISIQHEEIPNFMPAMTMPFTAKNPPELKGLQAGDKISFRMTVTPEESWIEQVKKVGTAPATTGKPPERPAVRLVRNVEPLEVGDLIPDYRFTNELGQAIQLADFKGKALALTFIFTRCPIPEFCPLMSRRFAEVNRILNQRPDAPNNWHLLSISFDPHFDTPEVLKRYAEAYQYDPKQWNFVTGAMIDIDAITEQFNLPVVVREGVFEHTLRTVVIDTAGRVQKIFIYNQWTVEELADEITKAASVSPDAGKDGEAIAAPSASPKPTP